MSRRPAGWPRRCSGRSRSSRTAGSGCSRRPLKGCVPRVSSGGCAAGCARWPPTARGPPYSSAGSSRRARTWARRGGHGSGIRRTRLDLPPPRPAPTAGGRGSRRGLAGAAGAPRPGPRGGASPAQPARRRPRRGGRRLRAGGGALQARQPRHDPLPDALPGRQGPDPVVVKTHQGDEGRVAWEALRALWARPIATGGVVTLAEPLAYLPEQRVLVQGAVPEERVLKDVMRDALGRRVARAARRGAGPPGPDGGRSRGTAPQRRAITGGWWSGRRRSSGCATSFRAWR